LGIEPLRESDRGVGGQVGITLRVARQHDQVVLALVAAGAVPPAAAPPCDMGLHSDDRLQTGPVPLLLKRPGSVHQPVVSNRQRRLLEFPGAPDEIVESVGAVQQRVLGVAVKMTEGHRTVGDPRRLTATRKSLYMFRSE